MPASSKGRHDAHQDGGRSWEFLWAVLVLNKIQGQKLCEQSLSAPCLSQMPLPGTLPLPNPGGASKSSEDQMAPKKITGGRQAPWLFP